MSREFLVSATRGALASLQQVVLLHPKKSFKVAELVTTERIVQMHHPPTTPNPFPRSLKYICPKPSFCFCYLVVPIFYSLFSLPFIQYLHFLYCYYPAVYSFRVFLCLPFLFLSTLHFHDFQFSHTTILSLSFCSS